MATKRNIEIGGIVCHFRSSAAVPRIYRLMFSRDLFKDMSKLADELDKSNRLEEKEKKKAEAEGRAYVKSSALPLSSLEMFENIAYVMAKHADPEVPDTPEDWLDGFNTFSIYQILPQIIDLWGLNVQTESESKKNFARLNAK